MFYVLIYFLYTSPLEADGLSKRKSAGCSVLYMCLYCLQLPVGRRWLGQSPLSPGKELGDCSTGMADASKGRCRKKVGYVLKGFSLTVLHVIG